MGVQDPPSERVNGLLAIDDPHGMQTHVEVLTLDPSEHRDRMEVLGWKVVA